LKFNLRAKLVGLAVAGFLILAGVLTGLWWIKSRANLEAAYVEKARSIVLAAESSREEMAAKWDLGLFSAEKMKQWADAGEIDKVLAAVPVVTAWKTSMNKAEEGGYVFKVPKFQPRNPKNEPDEVEARVLTMFQEQGLDEHYEIDHELNAIRYFRPIRLTQECMLCHGDPATSQALWGNDQGLDPTGTLMENWKVGDVHGAFEVVQSLDAVDAQLAASAWTGVVAAVLLVLGAAGAFILLLTRTVERPLRRAITHMRQGADEVADAAGQISTSSQSLADGAAQQAASLERTSASMEQMSAMVRQSADNARQARDTAGSAHEAVQGGLAAMQRMDDAIARIKSGSDETAKIIKTIDEIAFQTNLLALNASVEAARAGDAGKGFAVVAEEVRNLAQRSAEAARTTTTLIGQSRESADHGVTVTKEVAELLREITQGVQSVNALVDEVSTASDEQSKGVSQVNQAIVQMDQSTQGAAATAEESASASEELASQASTLRGLVGDLEAILDGQHADAAGNQR
jgi:methyl-accepting chemotaxis protein